MTDTVPCHSCRARRPSAFTLGLADHHPRTGYHHRHAHPVCHHHRRRPCVATTPTFRRRGPERRAGRIPSSFEYHRSASVNEARMGRAPSRRPTSSWSSSPPRWSQVRSSPPFGCPPWPPARARRISSFPHPASAFRRLRVRRFCHRERRQMPTRSYRLQRHRLHRLPRRGCRAGAGGCYRSTRIRCAPRWRAPPLARSCSRTPSPARTSGDSWLVCTPAARCWRQRPTRSGALR